MKAYSRRIHGLYLQRMHHSFHDIDFTSLRVRPLATISQTSVCPSLPLRQKQIQNAVLRSEADPSVAAVSHTGDNEHKEEKSSMKSMPSESSKRSHKKGKSGPQAAQKSSERMKTKQAHGASNANRDIDGPRHPLDLVFCRKKRKPRGKVLSKFRTIGAVASAENRNTIRTASGLDSHVGFRIVRKKVRTAGVNNISEGSTHAGMPRTVGGLAGVLAPLPMVAVQRAMPNRAPGPGLPHNRGLGIVGFGNQWLTPVKKMRTDGGKRRPGHVEIKLVFSISPTFSPFNFLEVICSHADPDPQYPLYNVDKFVQYSHQKGNVTSSPCGEIYLSSSSGLDSLRYSI